MSVNFDSSVIFVEDLNKSKKFYVNQLGLTVKYDFGANVILNEGISLWQISETHEIAQGTKYKQSNGFELCFDTDDIMGVVEIVKTNNFKLLHELKEEPWGQLTIRFFDYDGHLIEIGESLVTFIKRHMENNSMEEVSAKTGVSVEDIQKLLNG